MQKTISPHEDTSSEKMSTLSSSINLAISKGYNAEFIAQANGMLWDTVNKYYDPEEVWIDNFYRFEGESDPADASILYLISTTDGKKGVLIDAYGAYDDANVSEFVHKVREIHKKTNRSKGKYTHKKYYIAFGLLLLSLISTYTFFKRFKTKA